VKFLCVPCDQPMKLATLAPPDRGSLSVVYSCPACGYEMAMLTNPFETQMVQSLGVRVGPAADEAASPVAGDPSAAGTAPGAAAGPGPVAGSATEAGGSRCPFAGMIGATDAAGAATGADVVAGADPIWTDTAAERMKAIPAFVRPMARTGIERFARERGYATIDERVPEEARAFFGM
jgi:hypothetical protein